MISFAGRNNARHHVERKDALRALGIAVNIESDALSQEREIYGPAPLIVLLGIHRGEPLSETLIVGADATIRIKHLIIKSV